MVEIRDEINLRIEIHDEIHFRFLMKNVVRSQRVSQVFQAKDLNLILTLCKSSSGPEVPKK